MRERPWLDRLLTLACVLGALAVFWAPALAGSAAVSGCGGSQSSHDQTLIKATAAGIQGAAAALGAWDLEHLHALADGIKARGGTLDDYKAEAKAYEAARAGVVGALQDALSAANDAAAHPDEAHLATLALEADNLYHKIKDLGLNLQGVK